MWICGIFAGLSSFNISQLYINDDRDLILEVVFLYGHIQRLRNSIIKRTNNKSNYHWAVQMTVMKKVKGVIRAMDLFAQPVTFRYADAPDYESLTGGVVSVTLVVLFLVIFANTVVNTFKKEIIDSSTTRVEEEDPSFYKIGTDSFMFAIGLTGIDLNSGDKWFDIQMEQRIYNGSSRNKKSIEMQKCQKSQWTQIEARLEKSYDRLAFSSWWCPKPGTVLELQGKFSSEVFQFYKIGVKKCTATASRGCVSATTIENYLNANELFQFNFYYINTIVNPNNVQFLSRYLDDINYFPFSTTDGMNANFFLSTIKIETDESIYPVEDRRLVEGGASVVPTQALNYQVRQNEYMKFYIRKSSLSINIERSFQKIDDTLSYIGGLFSAILFALLVMKLYNEFSYELEIAKNLYHYDKNTPIKADEFNFLVFLGYLVYLFFDLLGVDLKWDKMRMYHYSLEEARKQMDIRLIMKKILYTERLGIAVFDEPKAKILHLQEPLTLQEAEQIRKDHRFYERLEKKYFDYEKIRQEDISNPVVSSLSGPGAHKGVPHLQPANILLMEPDIQIQMKDSNEKSSAQQNIKSIVSLEYELPKGPALRNVENQEAQRIQDKKGTKQNSKEGDNEKPSRSLMDMLSIFIDEQVKKENELKFKINKMKGYLEQLRAEAQQGDRLSEKILNRFDKKILKYVLEQEEREEREQGEQGEAREQETHEAIELQSKIYEIDLQQSGKQEARKNHLETSMAFVQKQ